MISSVFGILLQGRSVFLLCFVVVLMGKPYNDFIRNNLTDHRLSEIATIL